MEPRKDTGRYVQSEASCPSCGKPGYLHVQYQPSGESGWNRYFIVRHRKTLYERDRYFLLRRHGYSRDDAARMSKRGKPIEDSQCYFGRNYPGPIRNRIRGPNPNERKRRFRRHPEMPMRPLDSTFVPNKTGTFLTKAQADEIRGKYASGKTTQAELADEYHVDQSQISLIVNGKILSK